jgi:hypothetical protein
MIKLGITNFIFGRKNAASQDVLPPNVSAALLQSLLEAAAWCNLRSGSVGQLRSAELDPASILDIPDYSKMESISVWSDAKSGAFRRAVSSINVTRSRLLLDSKVSTLDVHQVLSKGKLLLYWPMETVNCGASAAGSGGFFDIEDAPAWDTWFHYSDHTIFSYVPESMISLAQDGIDGNPVDCIRWGKWSAILAGHSLWAD